MASVFIQRVPEQHGKGVAGKEELEVIKPGPFAVKEAVQEVLSGGELEVLECDNQSEHGQVAEQCVPDHCRQAQEGQFRVVAVPAHAAALDLILFHKGSTPFTIPGRPYFRCSGG